MRIEILENALIFERTLGLCVKFYIQMNNNSWGFDAPWHLIPRCMPYYQIRFYSHFMTYVPPLSIHITDSKVRGATMGPIWGRQDPGGPRVGPMNFVIWDDVIWTSCGLRSPVLFKSLCGLPSKKHPKLVNSRTGAVTRGKLPFDDVIMISTWTMMVRLRSRVNRWLSARLQ